MRFTETPIKGAFVIDGEPRKDDRGSFTRLWCAKEFAEHGLACAFVQCNGSVSAHAGTLRGLHYQLAPYCEVKFIRCIRGAVYDVIVDVRPDSATYLSWHGLELSAANGHMLYVPEGLAHGYLALEDDTEVIYPVSQYHQPQAERGIRWNDPRFAIEWPIASPEHISPKDRGWPDFVSELASKL